MSHVVTIRSKVHDPAAVAAACQRLKLAAPVELLLLHQALAVLVQLAQVASVEDYLLHLVTVVQALARLAQVVPVVLLH